MIANLSYVKRQSTRNNAVNHNKYLENNSFDQAKGNKVNFDQPKTLVNHQL